MIRATRVKPILLLCTLAASLSACSTDDGRTMTPPRPDQTDTVQSAIPENDAVVDDVGTMTVTGPWSNGSAIDARYSCDGDAMSPPLVWDGAPEDTQAYAVVIDTVDDPDVLNWVVTNIDFTITNLAEGATPTGAVVARNSEANRTYLAPCPPAGTTYTFSATVYALDALTPLDDQLDGRTILATITSSALEAATTIFTVTR